MKTVAFLFFFSSSFAFALVFTAPAKKSAEEYLQLQRIMVEANKTLNGGQEALLDHLVPAVFNQDRCKANGPEDFCIAEKILSAINLTQYGTPANISIISRVLKQYNKFHPTNCTVKENADEQQLHELLKNLYNCAQVIYARPQPAVHHKRPQRSAERRDGNSVDRAYVDRA